MRIAVLSDIHSNVFALEGVINDLQKRSVDLKVNLDDILYDPVATKATFELLIEHDFITISRNKDRRTYEASTEEIEFNSTMQFISDDLGSKALERMKSLPFNVRVSHDVYLYYGTQRNDLVYLWEDMSKGFPSLHSDNEIINLLAGQHAKIICCGHTHIPRAVTLSSNQNIVHPRSAGLQAYTDEKLVSHSMENLLIMRLT